MANDRASRLEAAQALLELRQDVAGKSSQGIEEGDSRHYESIVPSHHNRFSMVDFQQKLRLPGKLWHFPQSIPSQTSSTTPKRDTSSSPVCILNKRNQANVHSSTNSHLQDYSSVKRQQHKMGLTKINTSLGKFQQSLKSPFSPTFAKELLHKILTSTPQDDEGPQANVSEPSIIVSHQSQSPTKKRKLSEDENSSNSSDSFSTDSTSLFSTSPQFNTSGTELVLNDPTSPINDPFLANVVFDSGLAQGNCAVQSTVAPTTQPPTRPGVVGLCLKFGSFEEAEESEKTRMRLSVVNDDVEYVKANPHWFVAQLVQAFYSTVTPTPNSKIKLGTQEQAAWNSFQEIHVAKTMAYTQPDANMIERSAWKILRNVIDVHQSSFPMPTGGSIDAKTKCSDRVMATVAAIANYGIVRYDMIRLQKVDDLILSANGYVTRKVTNWKNNLNKTRRDEINAAECAKQGVQYRQVLGNKSKK